MSARGGYASASASVAIVKGSRGEKHSGGDAGYGYGGGGGPKQAAATCTTTKGPDGKPTSSCS